MKVILKHIKLLPIRFRFVKFSHNYFTEEKIKKPRKTKKALLAETKEIQPIEEVTKIQQENLEHFHFDEELITHFKFAHLCSIFQQLEGSSSMHSKRNILANFFKMIVNPEYQNNDFLIKIIRIILPSMSFMNPKANQVDEIPNKDILNLQYFKYTFEGLIEAYLKEEMKLEVEYIKENLKTNNDISEFLVDHFEPTSKKPLASMRLSIDDILNARQKIIDTVGNGTIREKLDILKGLYSRCSSKVECLYLTRILINKMRLGVGEKNIIAALELLTPDPELRKEENEYFFTCLSYLRDNLFNYNYSKYLLKDEFKPGKYFDVCLSKPEDVKSFLKTIQKKKESSQILTEIKYDGERTQLHYDKKEKLFSLISRAHENQNNLYTELTKNLQDSLKKNKGINNFIIDGEIVIYDIVNKKFGHFQDLRKKITNFSNQFKYFIIIFDILYFNDKPLFENSLEERKKVIFENFNNIIPEIMIENGKLLDLNLEYDDLLLKIKEEYKKAKSLSCEGLIIKLIGKNTYYHFSKRHWYKIKTIDNSSIDTLDLVPIAGFLGRGENKAIYSSFLMAVYDKNENIYNSLCFVGIGFTQEDLISIFERLSNSIIQGPQDNYVLSKSNPQVFFKPTEVWEIGFDNFTQSMNYPTLRGLVSDNPKIGISLRFPRFVRFREDKNIEQATNSSDLMSIYMNLYKGEDEENKYI